jgi:hypothetical protein
MPVSVRVPTTFDNHQAYDRLFEVYHTAMLALDRDRGVLLDFTGCTFLHQHAVAFLGGLIRHLQLLGCGVQVSLDSLEAPVRSNLRKNGFLKALGFEQRTGGNNAIPYREDFQRADGAFLGYLREEWLGRGWVAVSDRVADAISTAVWEIYTNAFEHGHSPAGVFSCGQFYPRKEEIALAFVDFGVGIPGSVRTVPQAAELDDRGAIAWALARGNTSKPGNRGVGLDILRAFVELNKGRMDVVSHRGHVRISTGGQARLTRNLGFPGTVFNITLKANEKRYFFQSEIDADSIF